MIFWISMLMATFLSGTVPGLSMDRNVTSPFSESRPIILSSNKGILPEMGDFLSEPSESEGTIPDPLEPVNRVFFTVNDRLYFWVFKPVATGYKAVTLEICG